MYSEEIMVPVNSKRVSAIGYDKQSGKAYAKFPNGSVYEYDDVPEQVVADIINTPGSKGELFGATMAYGYSYRAI